MPSFDDDNLERTVVIDAPAVRLEATLGIPDGASAVVVFAHGGGSSRFNARNRFVARILRDAGLGTLLIDLLSPAEEQVDDVTKHLRFDIPLLADRVIATIDWLGSESPAETPRVGLFGASTGGAAALVAAAERPDQVAAVVSRGGRPDLAGEALVRVEAATLLIVGERDDIVLSLNQRAMRAMHNEVQLAIVAGAAHQFEERGALDRVAALAKTWFVPRLSGAHRAA
jgi:putative phosphoribosyl transferase